MRAEKQSRSFWSLIIPKLEQIYRRINNRAQLSISQCLNWESNLICAEGGVMNQKLQISAAVGAKC